MIGDTLKRRFRDHLVGERGRFVFEPQRSVDLPPLSRIDLYVHIPFCRSLCPFCPYNRVPYREDLRAPYLGALLAEADAYRSRLGAVEIGSVYIGGGTPTTMLDELGALLRHLRKRFVVEGPVAVETLPSDLDAKNLAKLRAYGVELLSIGVQSFDDRFLKRLGRGYRADILAPAITRALAAGFDTVNLDLMFALPGQSIDDALSDLHRAIDLGADQVTLYPLLTFPYTAVGEHLKLQAVRFPDLQMRRRMYRALHHAALARGLNRISVWGFRRGTVPRFSSVTRDDYVGLGAGAGSCLPGMFYFNTFSVPEYVRSCLAGELPLALRMTMTPAMANWSWLYWRLYETAIPKEGLAHRFPHHADVRWMGRLARVLGLLEDAGDRYELTERGAFWIHLLQNHFVLNDIDAVWTRAMKDPWPERIAL